jgi:orotate phosphoribosyltransferase
MTDASALDRELIGIVDAREGHFLFESGHHGNLWLDLDHLFLRPRRIARFAAALAGYLARHEIEVVCGPLTGGAFLAQMIAAELDLEFCFTERYARPAHEGLFPVGYRIPSSLRLDVGGERVAVVDDAINAGSAVGGTLSALRECGAIPVAVGTLLATGAAAESPSRFDDLPLVSIAVLPGSLWLPSKCPLCDSRIPLERLVSEA